jgi:hypothetical protein
MVFYQKKWYHSNSLATRTKGGEFYSNLDNHYANE